jgi:hypothetical protein
MVGDVTEPQTGVGTGVKARDSGNRAVCLINHGPVRFHHPHAMELTASSRGEIDIEVRRRLGLWLRGATCGVEGRSFGVETIAGDGAFVVIRACNFADPYARRRLSDILISYARHAVGRDQGWLADRPA